MDDGKTIQKAVATKGEVSSDVCPLWRFFPRRIGLNLEVFPMWQNTQQKYSQKFTSDWKPDDYKSMEILDQKKIF